MGRKESKVYGFLKQFFIPTRGKVILTTIFTILVFLIVLGLPIPILSTTVHFIDSSKTDPNPVFYLPVSIILEILGINIKFKTIGFYFYIFLLLLYYYFASCLIIFLYHKIEAYIKKQNVKNR